MKSMVTRSQLAGLVDAFGGAWAGAPSAQPDALFTDDVEFSGSHRGSARGRAAVLELLRGDFAGLETVRITTTNHAPRARGDEALIGAYLHGEARPSAAADPERAVRFGGLLVVSVDTRDGGPRIRQIRFQLDWAEGRTTLLRGWNLPVMDRLWQPGDAPAVVVSELDAPWHRIPDSMLAISDEEAVADAWFRYAWGLDQADHALFEHSFSEDVEAELTPMGRMKGRRTLMGTLKAFRMPWPWMKHYGEPIQVDVEDGGHRARMILGRIMPGQTRTPEGKRMYAAHYRIGAVRDDTDPWRISLMEYVPGWINT